MLTNRTFIANVVRILATVIRSIPNTVWAYILFMSFGIGISVGYYALMISTTAFLIRVFGEVIEESNKETILAMTAVGASLWQKVFFVIIPYSFRTIILWIIHCIEVNIRSASIVGMVGGGGIGLVLVSYIKNFKYRDAFGLIITLSLMIIIIETILNCVKNRILYKIIDISYFKSIFMKKWYNIDLYLFGVVFLFVSSYSLLSLNIDWYKFILRNHNFIQVLINFIDISFDNAKTSIYSFIETIATSMLATIYSFIFGILFAQILSNNTNKCSFIRNLFIMIFSVLRTVPTFLWVLFALICFGFGPSSAIIGISVHSIAFFSKVFAQAFDDVSCSTISEIKSTGASDFQVFWAVIFPLSKAKIIGWTTLRVEINFAESIVLGMVGAGGIGFTIFSALSDYNYGKAGFAITIVIIFSIFIEQFSIKINNYIRLK